jgi:hypothetical protein
MLHRLNSSLSLVNLAKYFDFQYFMNFTQSSYLVNKSLDPSCSNLYKYCYIYLFDVNGNIFSTISFTLSYNLSFNTYSRLIMDYVKLDDGLRKFLVKNPDYNDITGIFINKKIKEKIYKKFINKFLKFLYK